MIMRKHNACRYATQLGAIELGAIELLLAFLLISMRVRKKFWLAPILLVMALLGALIVLAQGSAIAPFIYTLF